MPLRLLQMWLRTNCGGAYLFEVGAGVPVEFGCLHVPSVQRVLSHFQVAAQSPPRRSIFPHHCAHAKVLAVPGPAIILPYLVLERGA